MRCRGRPRLLYITDSSSSREVARTRGGEDERLEREGTAFDDPFSLESSSIDFWRPFTREPFSSLLASRRSPARRLVIVPRARSRAPASVLPGHGVRAERLRGVLRPPPVLARGRGARAPRRARYPRAPPERRAHLVAPPPPRAAQAALGAWFSTRLATRGDAPLYLGSVALALLESALLLRAALTPDGRALAPVANLAAASRLFLVLAAAKAYAAMYASRADAADVACFGVAAYLSHVQALALQSLERVLLTSPVLLARLRQEERRREEEEATVPNKAAATGPWFFTPEEGVGAVADEARNRPEGEPAPKRTSTPSDASANASTARDRVGAEGRSTRGCVEII